MLQRGRPSSPAAELGTGQLRTGTGDVPRRRRRVGAVAPAAKVAAGLNVAVVPQVLPEARLAWHWRRDGGRR